MFLVVSAAISLHPMWNYWRGLLETVTL